MFRDMIAVFYDNRAKIHKKALWSKCSKPDGAYIYHRSLEG